MISKCGATIVIIFLLTISGLRAQEPAFFQGSQAARFIVGTDVYHYVLPCGHKPAPAGGVAPATTLPALCWPVRVAKATIVSGKIELSASFIATMYISVSEFKLDPSDAKDVRFAFASPGSAVRTQYYLRSQSATFSTHERGISSSSSMLVAFASREPLRHH